MSLKPLIPWHGGMAIDSVCDAYIKTLKRFKRQSAAIKGETSDINQTPRHPPLEGLAIAIRESAWGWVDREPRTLQGHNLRRNKTYKKFLV